MTLVDAETGEIIETLDVHQAGYSGLVHHFANRYPMMKAAALDEMALDIAAHGQREPIWLDIEGHLIDGRNRLEACRLAGVSPRFKVYEGDDIEAFIVSKNEHRRDLSAKERQEIRRARAAELRGQGMSTRAIAEELEVDAKTVREDLCVGVGTDSPPPPVKVTGKDSKSYRASAGRKWTDEQAREFLARYHDLSTVDDRMKLADDFGLAVSGLGSRAADFRRQLSTPPPPTRADKIEQIRELSTSSLTASQIAAEVGLTEPTVRTYAKEAGITIHADKVMGKSRRLDPNRVLQATVERVAYDIRSDSALAAIDLADLDPGRLEGWISSLADSITSLTTLKKRLKELTR